MDTAAGRAVWQISGGRPSRSYAEVFTRYGVALVGPGDAGPWRPERGDDEFEGDIVRRFASEMQVGDVVLLRSGVSRIRAIGLVAGDYLYLDAFDDVNGLDLQHARRVRWYPLPGEYDFQAPVFGAGLLQCSRVRNPAVVDYAQRFIASPPTRWQTAPLPSLPAEAPPLREVPGGLEALVGEVQDLLPGYRDRQRFGEPPGEDELIAHFVVPFLKALGWRTEQIAVKWRRVDVALFSGLPRSSETCVLVIEAKRLGAGVEGALDQARGYVEALGVERDVVVTDGVRYRLYSAAEDFVPLAYANLARLKQPALDLFERLRRP